MRQSAARPLAFETLGNLIQRKINRKMNMNSILENHVSNKYKTQHTGKDKLERERRLPSTINVYIP